MERHPVIFISLLLIISDACGVADDSNGRAEALGKSRDPRIENKDLDDFEQDVVKLSEVADVHRDVHTVDGRAITTDEFGATFEFLVPAYGRECFFQPAKRGSTLHVQFHVGGADKGNEIDMEVADPTGKIILEELGSRGNMYGEHDDSHSDDVHDGANVKVTEEGDYEVCFVNSRSQSAKYSKRVYLDIGPVLTVKYKTADQADLPEEKVVSMAEGLDDLSGAMDLVMEMQQIQRWWHRRDLQLQEDNQAVIIIRAILIIFVMSVSVGLQVMFIRKFFGTASTSS